MRHYLHSTKVSMEGREQRHFPEKNEASIHTDQRFHYKICLQREEGGMNYSVGASGQLIQRGTGRQEPIFLALEAVVACTGTSMGIPFSRKSRMRSNMQTECLVQPSTVALSHQPDYRQWSHQLRQCVRHTDFGLLYMTLTETLGQEAAWRFSQYLVFHNFLNTCQTFTSYILEHPYCEMGKRTSR